ncbi:MAG: metallophosphoesterase, partial [Elusimicrobiota bacterium]
MEFSTLFSAFRRRSGDFARVARLPGRAESNHRRAEENVRFERLAAPWSTSANLKRLNSHPRGENEAFRFAVLGDAEPGRFWIFRKLFNVPGVFERQLRRIQGEGVDFSVQLGDMVSRGLHDHYRRLFEELSGWDVRVPYLSVIGNHDRRSPHGRSDSRL